MLEERINVVTGNETGLLYSIDYDKQTVTVEMDHSYLVEYPFEKVRKLKMETIYGNEIVKFIYDTGYEQISSESIDEATIKFENWINSNTKYRGLTMYAKHHGYDLIYEDKYGNKYLRNGMKTYRIDEYKNLIEEVK